MKNLEIQATYYKQPGGLLRGKSKIRKVALEKSYSNRYTYCQAALQACKTLEPISVPLN